MDVQKALRLQPLAVKAQLEAELCRRSMAKFMKLAWHVIEPNELYWSWHNDAICEHLQAVSMGQILKLLICVPPGMTKSRSTSTMWPAWDWISNPQRKFIYSSYAQEISEKEARGHRDVVASDWYQERFPNTRIDDVKKIKVFQNSLLGWRFSTSVGGAVTGQHGNVLVFDDLVKAQDAQGRAAVSADKIRKANDFWFKTMTTRRADAKTTARVGIMQRLHYEDTAQKCIERGYEALVLPMEFDPSRKCMIEVTGFEDPRKKKGELLCPERFPRDIIEEMKVDLGPRTYEAQFQQSPARIDGEVFKLSWFKTWDPKTLPRRMRKIITVDCATKDKKDNDFTAMQVWGYAAPNFYLLDAKRGQWSIGQIALELLEFSEEHPHALSKYIEDKANGPSLFQIVRGHVSGVNEWSPGRSSKSERAEAASSFFESGNVYFPPDELAPWRGEYEVELTQFPAGKNDDQVDATSMALAILYKPRRKGLGEGLRKILGQIR